MQDLDSMIRAVLLAPEDDTLRLICADAFEEVGQADHAAFIRWQLAGGKGQPLGWSRDWLPAGLREREWENRSGKGENNGVRYYGSGTISLMYRRGFAERIRGEWSDFLECRASGLFSEHPISRVMLRDRAPLLIPDADYPYVWGRPYDGEPDTPSTSRIPKELVFWPGWSAVRLEDDCPAYGSGEEAGDAMSAACVWYGRALAGLPV